MNKLIYDMPENEYFAYKALSNSQIKPLEKSGAHYLAELNKDREATKAQTFGKLVHTMCLEPEEMENRFYSPEKKLDLRKKEDKQKLSELTEKGITVITPEELEKAKLMSEEVKNNKASSAVMGLKGSAEVSAFWTDKETGLEMKGRFDYLSECGLIVDLKTTKDASISEFKKDIVNYKYHRQAAIYLDGYNAIHDKKAKGFVFIAIEKEAPFSLSVVHLNKEAIDQGRREYKRLLNKYLECESNGFKGYQEKIEEISLPCWAIDQEFRA